MKSNVVLEEQVIEQLLEQAQVTEVDSSYEEAIKPPDREEEAASDEEGSEEPDGEKQ